LFNKIEKLNKYVIIQNIIMWLIPDLLNILFDQANYESLVTLRCINKRRTKYANRYSVLSYYDAKNVEFGDSCEKGSIKEIIHVVLCVGGIDIGLALRSSVVGGNILAIKYLVSVGANINIKRTFGWCAYYGHLEIVKYLVSIGAKIHRNNDCALRWGAESGHLEVVRYLVSVGANASVATDHALRFSAENGQLEVVKYLVNAVGANVHECNDAALRWSARDGHLDVVKYLVSVGADINVNNGELFGIEMIRANFSHLRNT